MNINAITKKQLKGVLIITLLLVSAFLFIPMAFLQRSFANETIYTVNNEIWINATGISPSGDGEPTFVELKIEVSQSADNEGNLHSTANQGDRGFAPTAREDWLLFKDMKRSTSEDPSDQFTPASNMGRYFGFHYANNSVNLSSIPGSNFESKLPAVSMGCAVKEQTLVFEAPATYAAAYCAANGYSYVNVINSSYEQIINEDALNTYRSKFVESAMYTLSNSTVEASTLGETGEGEMHQQLIGWLVVGLVILAVVVFTPVIINAVANLVDAFTPDAPAPPPELDPPPTNEIENMTISAMELYTRFSEQALAAYLNGSISLEVYMAIVDKFGDRLFGALNNSVTVTDDLWRDYYNKSESLYNTYEDMYDNYLQAFSASWTDWLMLILIMIVVIVALVIIYKVVTKKTADNAKNAPTFITTK